MSKISREDLLVARRVIRKLSKRANKLADKTEQSRPEEWAHSLNICGDSEK